MKKYFSLAGLFSVLGLPLTSWAQTGQIIYQPSAAAIPPTAVPTLTTTALLLLVILIILAARWAGFGRNRLMSLFAGMLGVCALASGGLSMKLVSDAWADGGGGTNFAFFSSASGGSTPVNDNVLNIFENTSGVNQRIVSIILGACPNVNNGSIDGVERCEANGIVTTGEDGLCYTDCRDALPE
tara:strand:- start:20585 stop:21136 length:552 start_codon:yes stop_codon:yes gene_type:complete